LTGSEGHARDAGLLSETPPTPLKLVLRTGRPLEPQPAPGRSPRDILPQSARFWTWHRLQAELPHFTQQLFNAKYKTVPQVSGFSLMVTRVHRLQQSNSGLLNFLPRSQISVDGRGLFGTQLGATGSMQLGATGSTPAARSAYRSAATELCCRKSLCARTSLLSSFCFQHFRIGPAVNYLNKAFFKYSA